MKKIQAKFNQVKFGERITMLRDKYGLTQKDVAERLGKVRSLIAVYENGHIKPSIDVILSLRQLFIELGEKNISVDWLFGLIDKQEGVTIINTGEKEIYDLKKELEMLKESMKDKNQIIELLAKKK